MNSAQALAAAAQRELDALRAELDVRLAALEHALAHPDPATSLERLVFDLARVATAEAEAAAVRATLEAQQHAQAQGSAAVAEAQAALEAARASAATLRADLDAQRTAADALRKELGSQRSSAEGARREIDEQVAIALELGGELELTKAALAEERGSAAQVRRELGLARTEIQAAIDADAAQRLQIADLAQTRARLEQELADARDHASDTRAVDDQRHRAAIAALERRCAELDDAGGVARAQGSAALTERDHAAAERDRLARDLEADRTAAGVERHRGAEALAAATSRIAELGAEQRRGADALAAATARIAQLEAAREEAARGLADAESRVKEVSADRDELSLMLDAAKKVVQGMNAAVDERLAAIDGKRARALQAAEERAEAAIREREALITERDALAAALAAVPPPDAVEGGDARQQLEAATERIHALELQLFARGRGPRELDVDLGSLLPATPPPSIDRSGAPAARYGFKPPRRVKIDREGGLLVDLSVSGAQVICATAPEVGRVVTLTLLSDASTCFCQGRLLWSRREQTGKGRPYRYPAGIAFTAVDEAAIHAYIARHAPDQA